MAFLTRVEASSQGRPGFVVFPKVSQVPVTLVLHQADHLLVFKDKPPIAGQILVDFRVEFSAHSAHFPKSPT